MESSKHPFAEGCLICGKELIYGNSYREMRCIYCREVQEGNIFCPDCHFVCDKCHSKDAYKIIASACLASESVNPTKTAIELMKHPSVKMHGPEHHFLVAAVLLCSVLNKINEPEKKRNAVEKAMARAEKVPGGFCGSHGNCGAGVGCGVFVSVFTGATSLSKEEWKLSNLATSSSLRKIAESGGPRCCKRDSFLAIDEMISFVEDKFGIQMEKLEKIVCDFSARNKECIKEHCCFYPG